MKWLLLLSVLAASPAWSQTCRTDAGFLYKLTAAQERGQEALVGVGTIEPEGALPAPPQPVGLDPETGEIIPSTRQGPISATFRFSGDLHGHGQRRRVDDLPVILSISCAGFTCAVFPSTLGNPLAAYFILVRRDGALHIDGGPCKGFSRTLTAERSAALLACAEAGKCRTRDWEAFCDRQSLTPMHVCINAGLLVRDAQSGRYVPRGR